MSETSMGGQTVKVPDAHLRLQIAVHAGVNPRTVLRAYRSLPVRPSIAARLRAACRYLQLPEPSFVLAE